MSPRRLIDRIGPGTLGGMCLETVAPLLAANRIDLSAHPRALVLRFTGLVNSLVERRDRARHRRAVERTRVEAPLFVLGLPRSGTTLLQNLLDADPRLRSPSFRDVYFPSAILSAGGPIARLARGRLSTTRLQDQVRISWEAPAEDEDAFALLTGTSPSLGLVFQQRFEHYEQYDTFDGRTESERSAWKDAVARFARTLCHLHPERLVLRSSRHMSRLPLLLDLFPDARFLLIHRHPFDVLRSLRHLVRVAWETARPLQRAPWPEFDRLALRRYAGTAGRFFRERDLIPPGAVHQIRYDALEADPSTTLRTAYEALGLGDFTPVERPLRERLASIGRYEKNRHPALPPPLSERLVDRVPQAFTEWGYEPR